jgi:hypothetical protein
VLVGKPSWTNFTACENPTWAHALVIIDSTSPGPHGNASSVIFFLVWLQCRTSDTFSWSVKDTSSLCPSPHRDMILAFRKALITLLPVGGLLEPARHLGQLWGLIVQAQMRANTASLYFLTRENTLVEMLYLGRPMGENNEELDSMKQTIFFNGASERCRETRQNRRKLVPPILPFLAQCSHQGLKPVREISKQFFSRFKRYVIAIYFLMLHSIVLPCSRSGHE